jgi:hypothetical protein
VLIPGSPIFDERLDAIYLEFLVLRRFFHKF